VQSLTSDLGELIARRVAVLAEPVRVRLLDSMHAPGEASVGELAEALGRHEGPRSYYRIAGLSLIALCEAVCAGVRHALAELNAIVDLPTTVQEAR
jgi:DNA-binding transcriptional ArsR family regulator